MVKDILVVDNSEPYQKMLSDMYKGRVYPVGSFDQALRVLGRGVSGRSLMITELDVESLTYKDTPQAQGEMFYFRDYVQKCRKTHKRGYYPVIGFSDRSTGVLRLFAISAGLDAAVHKSGYDPSGLKAVVDQLLEDPEKFEGNPKFCLDGKEEVTQNKKNLDLSVLI